MCPLVVNSIFQASQVSKSAALAMALIYKDGTTDGHPKMPLEQCMNIARLAEQHQQSVFGVVEGAHDFDHANTLVTLATARSVVSLAKMRDF